MEQLLPDRLKELWRAVDENQLNVEAFTSEQEQLLLDDYRRTWTDALILEGHDTKLLESKTGFRSREYRQTSWCQQIEPPPFITIHVEP